LKIALSPYLSRELSDLDQILYTDTNVHSERERERERRSNPSSSSKIKVSDVILGLQLACSGYDGGQKSEWQIRLQPV